jgi:hypothetical protein
MIHTYDNQSCHMSLDDVTECHLDHLMPSFKALRAPASRLSAGKSLPMIIANASLPSWLSRSAPTPSDSLRRIHNDRPFRTGERLQQLSLGDFLRFLFTTTGATQTSCLSQRIIRIRLRHVRCISRYDHTICTVCATRHF